MSFATFKSLELVKFLNNIESNYNKIKKAERSYANALSPVIYADIIDHFEKEKGPDGYWSDWSESYEKHMQRIGRSSNKLLQFNGFLRNNFKPTNFRSKLGQLIWYNDAQTKKGFPYAYAHDNDDSPRKTLDRRSFMWLSENAMNKISDISLKYFLESK